MKKIELTIHRKYALLTIHFKKYVMDLVLCTNNENEILLKEREYTSIHQALKALAIKSKTPLIKLMGQISQKKMNTAKIETRINGYCMAFVIDNLIIAPRTLVNKTGGLSMSFCQTVIAGTFDTEDVTTIKTSGDLSQTAIESLEIAVKEALMYRKIIDRNLLFEICP